jgi:hypothetical protein
MTKYISIFQVRLNAQGGQCINFPSAQNRYLSSGVEVLLKPKLYTYMRL